MEWGCRLFDHHQTFRQMLVAYLFLLTLHFRFGVASYGASIPPSNYALKQVPDPNPEYPRRARIAFVFAGSSRSFIAPAVHDSIRFNLIRALCPAPRCVGDVFVRLSTSDNNHRGYDSVGILKNETSLAVMRRVEAALQRLKTPGGKLIVRRVDIGSADETADMDAHLASLKNDWDAQMRHKVYRYLDSRRYSMYFARYLAYLMVAMEEEEMSLLSGTRFKYDWVVHARLDAGWGEALLPFWEWDIKKMYTPNSWFADVPDTFALTPRHLSDIYFSLDMLIKTTIICLGGPNFDPKTATKEYLKNKMNWGEMEYAIVHRELCLTQHPTGFHLIHDKKNNLYWSMSGFSEYFLKRKLADQGVTLNNANIDYYPFFIFIVREPLGFVCFYLDPQYFMPWVKTWQSAAGASASGCYGMHDALNRLYEQRPMLTSCDARQSGGHHGDSFHNRCDHSLLDGEITDWNFNPFRLRHKSKCVGAKPSRIDLNTSDCINFFRKGEFLLQYKPEQLYFFHPLIQEPQRIFRYDWDSRRECLTVVRPHDGASSSKLGNSKNVAILQMRPCEMHNTRKLGNNQLFVVELLDRDKFELKQTAAKVVGWEQARPLLGPVTKVIIRWVGDQKVSKPAAVSRRHLLAFDAAPASLSITLGLGSSDSQGQVSMSENSETGLIGSEEEQDNSVSASDRGSSSSVPAARARSGTTDAISTSSSTDECVTVRRIRSRSYVGQFETQLVLRKCPSDSTIRSEFGGRTTSKSFNNFSADALLVASNSLHDRVGVANPFPPGSTPQGPKDGQTGLIERVGGVKPSSSQVSQNTRRLLSREETLTRSRRRNRVDLERGEHKDAATGVFGKAFYDMKERRPNTKSNEKASNFEFEKQSFGARPMESETNKRGTTLSDFVFTLERTRSFGTPYAPGITIGKVPSWYYND